MYILLTADVVQFLRPCRTRCFLKPPFVRALFLVYHVLLVSGVYKIRIAATSGALLWLWLWRFACLVLLCPLFQISHIAFQVWCVLCSGAFSTWELFRLLALQSLVIPIAGCGRDHQLLVSPDYRNGLQFSTGFYAPGAINELSALALVNKPLDLFVPFAETPAAADVGCFKAIEKDGRRHVHASGAVILYRPFKFL